MKMSRTKFLKLYPLVEFDRNVLQTIENQFVAPDDDTDGDEKSRNSECYLQFFQFFAEIILEDFSAEIFLQRPQILMKIYNYLKRSTSTKIRSAILDCLSKLTDGLRVKLRVQHDHQIQNESRIVQRLIDDELTIGEFAMRNLQFCSMILLADFGDNYKALSTVTSALMLFRKSIHLLVEQLDDCGSNNDNDAAANNNNEDDDIAVKLRKVLKKAAAICEHFERKTANSSIAKIIGQIHIYFVVNLIDFCYKSIPVRLRAVVIANELKTRFYAFVDNWTAPILFPATVQQAILVMQTLDNEPQLNQSFDNMRAFRMLETSVRAACDYLNDSPRLDFDRKLQLIAKASYAIAFHECDQLLEDFFADCFGFCNRFDSLTEPLISLLEETLVNFLQCQNTRIARKAYEHCSTILENHRIDGKSKLFYRRAIITVLLTHGLVSCDPDIVSLTVSIFRKLFEFDTSGCYWIANLDSIADNFPLMACFVARSDAVASVFMRLINPETNELLGPQLLLAATKAYLVMLFNREPSVRTEALMFVYWLLISEPCCDSKLPDLQAGQQSGEFDTNICYESSQRLCETFDFTIDTRRKNSVLQKLASLKEQTAGKRLLLQQIFMALNWNGAICEQVLRDTTNLDLLVNLLDDALLAARFETDPDAIVALVGILKNLALFAKSVRDYLSQNLQLLQNLLRSLLLKSGSEPDLKTNGSQLIFLLVFNDFIETNNRTGSIRFRFESRVLDALQLPSLPIRFAVEQRPDAVKNNRVCKLYWNKYRCDTVEVPGAMILTNGECKDVEDQSPILVCEWLLVQIENAIFYDHLLQLLTGLVISLKLINLTSTDTDFCQKVLTLNWQSTLEKYLNANEIDTIGNQETHETIQIDVYKILHLLMVRIQRIRSLSLVTSASLVEWLATKLQQNKMFEFNSSNLTLAKHQIQLTASVIEAAAAAATATATSPAQNWLPVIDRIVDQLQAIERDHFNDLTLVQSLLNCWISIGSVEGWSCCCGASESSVTLGRLQSWANQLCGLFKCLQKDCSDKRTDYWLQLRPQPDFYSGSVIGSGIVRKVLIILYQLIREFNTADFTNSLNLLVISDPKLLTWSFETLVKSEELIIRAEFLQLLAEYAKKPSMATALLESCLRNGIDFWQISLRIGCDDRESFLIREQSFELLANIFGHSRASNLYCSHFRQFRDFESDFCELLTEMDLFGGLRNYLLIDCVHSANVVFVRNLLVFLRNFLRVTTTQTLLTKLTNVNFVHLVFSCLLQLDSQFKLAAYRNERFQLINAILMILNTISILDSDQLLKSISVNKDRVIVLVNLLSYDRYESCSNNDSYSIYLRNRIWIQTFKLLSNVVLKCSQPLPLPTINETIIKTISESLKNGFGTELQQNAFGFLTIVLSAHDLQSYRSLNFEPLAQQLIDMYYLESYESNETQLSDRKHRHVQQQQQQPPQRNIAMILASLNSLVCVSSRVKKICSQTQLVNRILSKFHEYSTIIELKSFQDKKSVFFDEVNHTIRLLNNLMYTNDNNTKTILNSLYFLTDLQKLWKSIVGNRSLLLDTLKMLATLTKSSKIIDQISDSLKRQQFSQSITSKLIALVHKEMDLISRTHSVELLQLAFEVLENCCSIGECRSALLRSNLLAGLVRLNPAYTKKQHKHYESVEFVWLHFVWTLTLFADGQFAVLNMSNSNAILTIFLDLAKLSSSRSNRQLMLDIFRNLCLQTKNRLKFLASDDFLQLIYAKLDSDYNRDIDTAVNIIWSLIANNQRAKLTLKSKGFATKLKDLVQKLQISSPPLVSNSFHNTLDYVHKLF